jgi:cytochrome c peroxidase
MRNGERMEPLERAAWVLVVGGLALGLTVVASGCEKDPFAPAVDGFSPIQLGILYEMRLGNPPPDPTNRFADDPTAARFGQLLFFDRDFSGMVKTADPQGLHGGRSGMPGVVGQVGCQDCHDPQRWFTDVRTMPNSTSLGTDWTKRNTPGLVNSAYYRWFGWAGVGDSMWNQVLIAVEADAVMNSTRLRVAHTLFNKYRAQYELLFGPLPDRVASLPADGKPKAPDGVWESNQLTDDDRKLINGIFANYGKALAAYIRRLKSGDAPLDAYIEGDRNALSPAAKRGLQLFLGKANCVQCHLGVDRSNPYRSTTLTDNLFHNTGVPEAALDADGQPINGLPAEDDGRSEALTKLSTSKFTVAGAFSDQPMPDKLVDVPPSDLSPDVVAQRVKRFDGQFRTKGLREISVTGPYMHNGAFQTLQEVVEFYNRGGGDPGTYVGTKDPALQPLELTASERSDLVTFLTEALTGAPVDATLTVALSDQPPDGGADMAPPADMTSGFPDLGPGGPGDGGHRDTADFGGPAQMTGDNLPAGVVPSSIPTPPVPESGPAWPAPATPQLFQWQGSQVDFLDRNGQPCKGSIALATSDHATCYADAMGTLVCAGSIYTNNFGPVFTQVMPVVGQVKQILLSSTVGTPEANAACVLASDGSFSCMGDDSRVGLPASPIFMPFSVGIPIRHLATGTWDQLCGVQDDGAVFCSTSTIWPPRGAGTAMHSFWVSPSGQFYFDNPDVYRASNGRTDALVTIAGLATTFSSFGTPGKVVDGYIDTMTTRACWLESSGHVICRDLMGAMPPGPPSPAYDLFGGGVLAMAADGYSNNICAAKRDGSLWCMGSNARGQLGTGRIGPQPAPAPIPLPSPLPVYCQ